MIAGFFIYTVTILGFATLQSVAIKIGIMFGFSVPAVCALWAGFALNRFHLKLRDTGIVFLSSAGFTTFLILTFVCLLATEEFRKMMKPDVIAFFSDYAFGFGFLLITATIGVVALRKGIRRPNQSPTPTAVTPPAAQEPRQP